MISDREISKAEFEQARNFAADQYFDARQQIDRTIERERIFEAGYRMAWEFLKSNNLV